MARYDFKKLQAPAERFRATADGKAFETIERALRSYITRAVTVSCYGQFNEDLYQQCLLDLVRVLRSPSWNPQRQPFFGILKRVVSNTLRTHNTHQTRLKRLGQTVSLDAALRVADGGDFDDVGVQLSLEDDFADQMLQRIRVQQAMAVVEGCLGPRFLKKFLETNDMVQAARVIGITASGARARLRVAGRRFREAQRAEQAEKLFGKSCGEPVADVTEKDDTVVEQQQRATKQEEPAGAPKSKEGAQHEKSKGRRCGRRKGAAETD